MPEWVYPSAGYRQFENFVVDQQVPHGHLYAAFPSLSANEIRSALRLHQEVEAHHRSLAELERFGSADTLRAETARLQYGLLQRLQHSLGGLPTAPDWCPRIEDPVNPAAPGGDSLTALLPFPHDATGEMEELLADLSIGAFSPFALPGTHFARLAIIGRSHFERRSTPAPDNAYLLVSAEIDQPAATWLQALHERPDPAGEGRDLDRIWKLCHGAPSSPDRRADTGAFVRWVLGCRIRPGLQYIDYPGAQVSDIARAIAALTAGARRSDGPPPVPVGIPTFGPPAAQPAGA